MVPHIGHICSFKEYDKKNNAMILKNFFIKALVMNSTQSEHCIKIELGVQIIPVPNFLSPVPFSLTNRE